jgi:hypothetical protein
MENNFNENVTKDSTVLPVEEVVETPAREVETPVVEIAVEPRTLPVEDPAPVVAEAPKAPDQALGFLKSGAIGSMAADGPKPSDAPKADNSDKVAIHSTRNVSWPEAGKVYRGFNIVTKAAADKWLSRDHIRLATPDELRAALEN